MWSVVGQTRIVNMLENSIKQGRLSHAYLLAGPPHVGKMTLALDLARRLNCPEAEPPCGRCSHCRRITDGKYADVIALGLAQNPEAKTKTEIGIDQIKDMQKTASLPPYEGSHKVFIINGAEYLSPEASNRLLKILEEPPSRVLFLLLTANERLLLPTVVSRCHKLELLPMPLALEAESLAQRWGVEPQKADLLSRLSRGCLGWAVSAAKDGELMQQRQQTIDMVQGVHHGSLEQGFSLAARLAARFGHNRQETLEMLLWWQDWWRDIMLVKSGNGGVVTNGDQQAALAAEAENHTLEEISQSIRALGEARTNLELNANPRLALEVLMLSLAGNRAKVNERVASL